MRNPKWTTTRWRRPATLRKERLIELLKQEDSGSILGWDFIEGLEKRRKFLDARRFKLLGWQAPIFLFLAMSLVASDSSGTIFGISIASAKSLREVLIILSATLGLIACDYDFQISDLKEMFLAIISKQADKDDDLKQFLSVRFGVSPISPLETFSSDLAIGKFQFSISIVLAIAGLAMILMLIFIAFSVQILNLVEVYQHPNFSHFLSLFVIAYALLGDIVVGLGWLLRKSFQPYETLEDFKKLQQMKIENEGAYRTIIQRIARDHASKGIMSRIFGRPKMPRLPK